MRAPRKKDYVQRAHTNPFTDKNIVIPKEPNDVNWRKYYENDKKPDFLDLGCGYGKFLFFLAEKYNDKNMLGMEIRCKVAEYVNQKIIVGRHLYKNRPNNLQNDKVVQKGTVQEANKEYSNNFIYNEADINVNHKSTSTDIVEKKLINNSSENAAHNKTKCTNIHAYDNIAVLHTNGMLFLQNFFDKNTLEKIFVLFPDPHFKKKKQKARIICKQMLDTYSYVLQQKGRIYISTDVKTYYDSMIACFEEHCDFLRVTDELEIEIVRQSDEALRAGVKTGESYGAVYEKIK
ncbi:tRNA (guanine-N(7)-)-methyltransferase (tRNA(m7G46)-methyltransferase) [Binucleata daphniae]